MESLVLLYALLRKYADLFDKAVANDPLNEDDPSPRLVLFSDGSGRIDGSFWNNEQGWHTLELANFGSLEQATDVLLHLIHAEMARQAAK